MTCDFRLKATAAAAALLLVSAAAPTAQIDALAPPGFHHLHLNSTNPEAAIAFYVKAFPSTSKTTWGDLPALRSPENVLVLFSRVNQPPATQPESAVWHFGWHVTDVRQTLERFRRDGVTLLPLYTGDGGTVAVSSDTWPGTGGVLGLTKAQIADAKTKGVKPNGGAGFAYMRGPDDALVEYQGNMPAERFNHVHMYQEDPFCAQQWYRRHLNASMPQGRGGPPGVETNCKVARGADTTWPALEIGGTYRTPTSGVIFGSVAVNWYMRQGDRPLVSTRGQLVDHVALSVTNLDGWMAKLRREGVKILAEPYRLGTARAALIEGPSLEALELVDLGR